MKFYKTCNLGEIVRVLSSQPSRRTFPTDVQQDAK